MNQLISSRVGEECKFKSMSIKCDLCERNVRRHYQYENTIVCDLCNIILKFDVTSVQKGILCLSDKSQKDIVRETIDFLKENQRMPNIHEIDPNAKMLGCNMSKIIILLERKSEKELKYFPEFKIFFTDKINFNFFGINIFGSKFYKYSDYEFFSNNKLEKVPLTKDQKYIIKSIK